MFYFGDSACAPRNTHKQWRQSGHKGGVAHSK